MSPRLSMRNWNRDWVLLSNSTRSCCGKRLEVSLNTGRSKTRRQSETETRRIESNSSPILRVPVSPFLHVRAVAERIRVPAVRAMKRFAADWHKIQQYSAPRTRFQIRIINLRVTDQWALFV